ncbi:hypothetical protein KUCAC02_035747, partial [Chaenocephalus aceratus]
AVPKLDPFFAMNVHVTAGRQEQHVHAFGRLSVQIEHFVFIGRGCSGRWTDPGQRFAL